MASSRRSLVLALILGLLVVSASGCGGSGSDTPQQTGDAGAAPQASTPGSASESTTYGGLDWKQRRTGLPAAGDPLLDDIAFLRAQPRTEFVYCAMGDYWFRQTEGDSAIANYERAVELAPEDPAMLNALALAYKNFDRREDAERALIRAMDADPVYIHTFVNLGNLLFLEQEYDRAVANYRLAVNIDSTAYTPWFNLGLAYDKLEDSDLASRAYFKAISCDPDDPKSYEKLGDVYYSEGQYKSALRRWSESLQRDPSRSDIREKIGMLEDYFDSTGTR